MDRFETKPGNHGHHRAAQSTRGSASRILVIGRDTACLDQVVSALSRFAEFQITCVANSESPGGFDFTAAHDLVVVDCDPFDDVSFLVSRLRCIGDTPMIALGSPILATRLIESVRGPACEIILKPFASERFVESVRLVLRAREQARSLAVKYRKMRELVRRVVRERRDLHRRVELVCRDLVEAHRRLTYRFVELQKSQSRQPT